MNIGRPLLVFAAVIMGMLSSGAGLAKPLSRDIAQTPHNLSASGGGGAHDIKSATETRICVFCHTPHHATSVTPLWSREVSSLTVYVPYKSPTIKANPQQPMGTSRLCLSCHDGTIALGHLARDYVLDPGLRAFRDMPQESDPRKNPNLGTDLSDDHPISFGYSYGINQELNDPLTLQSRGIKLEQGQYVECTSCHEPHNNQYGNFLVRDVSVQHDALCTECHNKQGWSNPDNAHRTGGGLAGVSGKVAADGCTSCHLPHNAQKAEYLLKLPVAGAGEETNCYISCHREAPYGDIWSKFNSSLYRHPVQAYYGTHEPNETLPLNLNRKHVECVDCHNPHQAGSQGFPLGDPFPRLGPASVAPNVNGPLYGVRGVDMSGTAVVAVARYEYEICYRCHSGASSDYFTSLSAQLPARLFSSYDESERFNPANPSFHPITVDRKGNGRSLLSQYQAKMIRIYCNDCHDPHGSNEPHMLRGQNSDTFPSLAITYPLCYRCHDEFYLMNNSSSANLHRSHMQQHNKKASCSNCHDPHGIPASTGADSINAGHLINFDKIYAGANLVAGTAYNATSRTCLVNGACHTGPQPYPAY
ncbi:cytochrome c3 family protein [Geobacter sp. SVR]|uniref:cytochrome c3 family protein n=1 Tax=Geobacter sp. SVR TaxID=2495594 RepID=UPI00143EFF42|nr:cytochrome c3 family protein [Geobacter sp. SVR]BCS53270.1 cytochrome c [Geobacter sp. SVR]GCF85604.1 cytochrome c [Geobacter sp. SVR]